MKSAKKRKPRGARVTVTQTQRHAWVWRVFADPALSHPAKDVALVLGLLYFNDGQNGRCNPGYTGIAEATCWARSVVQNAIEELVEGGWISFTSVGGGSEKNTNRYTIHWTRTSTRLAGGDDAGAARDDVATRVAKYDVDHPDMTSRQVARALGVSQTSVMNARKSSEHSGEKSPNSVHPQPIEIKGVRKCAI